LEVQQMSWFWLNMPLAAAFFLATAGIPLWMVLRHPGSRAANASAVTVQAPVATMPVLVGASSTAARG
jgi:hypothetical protein